jgi:hypothetical protein
MGIRKNQAPHLGNKAHAKEKQVQSAGHHVGHHNIVSRYEGRSA